METNVLHVNPPTLVTQVAKVCSITFLVESVQNAPLFSECKCNPDGSTTLECGAMGECTCKNGFSGNKCDTCAAGFDNDNKCESCAKGYYNYPNCKGTKYYILCLSAYFLMLTHLQLLNFFQNVNVTRKALIVNNVMQMENAVVWVQM